MDKVKLEDYTWPEVQESLRTGLVDTVVITIGSTEQHGPHLPLATDALLAQAVGEELAKRLGRALLAPPVRVGCSDHHMAFAGTISIQQETLASILRDYVVSLARHGFRNVVLVPTHGGNFRPVAAIVGALKDTVPQTNVVAYTSLESFIQTISAASSEFGVPPEAAGGHADETETSLILALRPDLVHMERAVAGYVGSTESIASILFARGMPALADDFGSDALANLAIGRSIERKREVRMRVHVDESRGNHQSRHVDDPVRLCGRQIVDRSDGVSFHSHVTVDCS